MGERKLGTQNERRRAPSVCARRSNEPIGKSEASNLKSDLADLRLEASDLQASAARSARHRHSGKALGARNSQSCCWVRVGCGGGSAKTAAWSPTGGLRASLTMLGNSRVVGFAQRTLE